MKTVITQITALILIGFFSLTAPAYGKTPDTLACLQLSGKILKLKKEVSNSYTVALIRDNVVLESKTIKGNNEFKFNLKKNGWYTVRILKEGYVCRTIIIDTKLAEEHEGYYKFTFDTELIDEQEALKLNQAALNMPIAHIAFDKKKRWFTHNETYTQQVKKKMYTGHLQLNK